jgi:hypothetical protein
VKPIRRFPHDFADQVIDESLILSPVTAPFSIFAVETAPFFSCLVPTLLSDPEALSLASADEPDSEQATRAAHPCPALALPP